MKDYDIVGYLCDDGIYCPKCAKKRDTPLFAGDEHECRQYCEGCFEEIEVNVYGED